MQKLSLSQLTLDWCVCSIIFHILLIAFSYWIVFCFWQTGHAKNRDVWQDKMQYQNNDNQRVTILCLTTIYGPDWLLFSISSYFLLIYIFSYTLWMYSILPRLLQTKSTLCRFYFCSFNSVTSTYNSYYFLSCTFIKCQLLKYSCVTQKHGLIIARLLISHCNMQMCL